MCATRNTVDLNPSALESTKKYGRNLITDGFDGQFRTLVLSLLLKLNYYHFWPIRGLNGGILQGEIQKTKSEVAPISVPAFTSVYSSRIFHRFVIGDRHARANEPIRTYVLSAENALNMSRLLEKGLSVLFS